MIERLRDLLGGARLLALSESVLSIILILVGAALAIRLLTAVARGALAPRGDRFLDETRSRTLQPLVESLLRYVIYFIAFIMILRETGVDATAILASAGVVGLAVGFGAQHVIRDVISGFFILAEGLIRVGDVIRVGEHEGLVENVSVRTTSLRKYNGELWSIRNGELNVFGNLNRDFSRAIVEVAVSAPGDVQQAMALVQQADRRLDRGAPGARHGAAQGAGHPAVQRNADDGPARRDDQAARAVDRGARAPRPPEGCPGRSRHPSGVPRLLRSRRGRFRGRGRRRSAAARGGRGLQGSSG